jgi:hypothetical protein
MIALISAVLVVFKVFATLCVISLILLVVAHFNVVSSCFLVGVKIVLFFFISSCSFGERIDLFFGFCQVSS